MAFIGGTDWSAHQNALHQWTVNGSGLAQDHVVWAQQYAPRPADPAISMRLTSLDDLGLPWLNHEIQYITFSDITITSVDASANTFTATAHGRLTGDGPVRLTSTGTFPGGTAASTDYWIIKIDNDTFKLASKFVDAIGLVAIDLTSTGSGTIQLIDTASTLRAGEEIHHISRGLVKVTLTLECFTSVGVGMEMATSVLRRVASRRHLPSQKTILDNANIGVIEVGRVRALFGVKEVTIFEPRALVEIQLCFTNDERESGTIIERTDITNLLTGQVTRVE